MSNGNPPTPAPIPYTPGQTAMEITKLILASLTPILLAYVATKSPTQPVAPEKPVPVVTATLDDVVEELGGIKDALQDMKPATPILPKAK